jgi:signal transduction histidine kinase
MTPITVIKGYIDLMTEKILGELTEKQKNALDTINKYFARLEEIKNNLSKLYVGVASPIEERLEETSIEVLIRTTVEDVMPFANKRSQKLSIEVERDIPHIMMDRGGIRQVLVNLLLNSVRFTADGGNIVVRAKDSDQGIRIEVEDDGVGIPKAKLENIFESFYEVGDTDKHFSGTIEFKSGGMGLGLTIAKNIVAAHEGDIWAESELGKFTRIILTLPKKKKQELVNAKKA